ncbi:hypothetical protein [Helicobacter suis]|uniref:hypothetical protein n=1 Tax=Helicobacter suis TaxID=104628 RepID=UPI0013D8DBD3|nr:hypothetical protein [Helicobacter suis]
MKILLVNQNKMVGKLFENIAKKLNLELVAVDRVRDAISLLQEDNAYFFFADDTAVGGEEYAQIKPYLENVHFKALLHRKGVEECEGFTHCIQKPFLPTDVLYILQRVMDTSPSDQAPKQAPSPQVEQTQSTDTNFLEDIDSSLDQLKGLLDVPGEHEASSSTPEQQAENGEHKEEHKEEAIPETPTESQEPITSQELPQAIPQEQEQKEQKAEETNQTPLPPETKTQETPTHHDNTEGLNLEDLLPLETHPPAKQTDSTKEPMPDSTLPDDIPLESHTHADSVHMDMLEDLMQENSPEAQELMDSMHGMDSAMHTAMEDIQPFTDIEPSLAQEAQEMPQEPTPTESSLTQDVESEEPQIEESKKEEIEAKEIPPSSQDKETNQEVGESTEIENAEKEPQEPIQESQELKEQPETPEIPSEKETQPQESSELENLTPVQESTESAESKEPLATPPEKESQEFEKIEDIPEPVMASVMDESEIPNEEAKQEAQPKSTEAAEEVKEEEKASKEEETSGVENKIEEEANKEDKKAEATPQEQAPQEEIPQEEQPSLPPLSLSFDLQTLLKDLPIDPKILENKTLHVQVQLADKT